MEKYFCWLLGISVLKSASVGLNYPSSSMYFTGEREKKGKLG
jgi:hypothetical protein